MQNVMGMVSVFIGISIILGIGVMILGETGSSIDCSELNGAAFDAASGWTSSGHHVPDSAITANDKYYPAQNIGWAEACEDVAAQSQDGFNLFVIILIVVAAVAILVVVRML